MELYPNDASVYQKKLVEYPWDWTLRVLDQGNHDIRLTKKDFIDLRKLP